MSDDEDDVAAEQASPEVERKARDMGWVPPSEWRAAPPRDGFLEPQEFVRRGEKIMPDGMKLISIEELYTAGLVTLDCADSKDW